MAFKMVIKGQDALIAKFKEKAKARERESRRMVEVGYKAEYALMVHEDLEAFHKTGTQAKFLEQPARAFSQEIAAAIRKVVSDGGTIDKALLAGGELLLEYSQKIVPVDKGELKASGYVEVVPKE